MKKKTGIITSAIIAALAIIACVFLLILLLQRPHGNRTVLAFDYNDSFEAIPMQNANQESVDSLPENEKSSMQYFGHSDRSVRIGGSGICG